MASETKQAIAIQFHERLVNVLRDMREELSCIHDAPEKARLMIPASLVITNVGAQLLEKSAALLSEISKAAE